MSSPCLREHGDDAKVLAGGQSLVPMLALRLTSFPHLVDVNRVAELDGIERDNGMIGDRRGAHGSRPSSGTRRSPTTRPSSPRP